MRLRSLFLIALFLFTGGWISAQNWIAITSGSPAAATTTLVATDASSTVVEFNLKGFNMIPVATPRGEAFVIDVEGSTSLLEQGKPDLPKLTASLIIPDHSQMAVRVVSSRYIDYPNMEIAPSKGSFTRDIDPSTVPYSYGKTYDRDEFFPAGQAALDNPYILRDYRGQVLVANPFSYNPITKTLRVYFELTLEVYADGISDINVLNRKSQPEKTDSEFQRIYERHFLNAGSATRYTPLEEEGNMLIISYGAFIPELQAFKEWKTTIGRQVEIVDVATIGNAAAIKTFVANYYTNHGLTYLLLVGDHAQVPTIMGDNSLGGPSDPAYGYILGNDHYPEVIVGRFSAENASHVTTQVNRTITYEKNPNTATDWFTRGIGLASNQGPGDNNEFDFQHINIIKGKLLDFSYTYISEMFDGYQGGLDLPGNPSANMVATDVNTGVSIINYTGHGQKDSWSTSDFSNSHINQLTNNHGWPFILSVACINGEFMNATCFAEAWLRASNAQGPTGAIGALMSTVNQLWLPPMRGQDEMIDILVESYDNNIKRTFGGLTSNGCMEMMDVYPSNGGIESADTWLVFGDPSVMVRTKMPQQVAVQHNPDAFIGSTQFEIDCDTENAYACLSMNGEILGTAYIQGGQAVIEYPAINQPGTMKLAVTAFNCIPYVVDIAISPLDGPYVSFVSVNINDAAGNNNQQLDYNESVMLSLAFKNVGILNVENVQVTLSTDNPLVNITDATALYPSIPVGETVSIIDGFALSIGNDLPDGQKIRFNFVAIAGAKQWTGGFSVPTNSAVLEFDRFILTDENGNNNGKADIGETFELNISIGNEGGASAGNLTGVLSTTDEYILISENSLNYGTINGHTTLTKTFSVTASPQTPPGHEVEFLFNLTADGGFASSGSFLINVGQKSVLIIDLDSNKNSGPKMKNSLDKLSIPSDYVTLWPEAMDTYQSVFVCLGTYPNGHALTAGEGQSLANFLNNGGKAYMEGGDTWYQNVPTAAHPLFMITGMSDGAGDLQTLNGQPGTITKGMSFSFGGDNKYIDRLSPKTNAVSLFKNSSPEYHATISYNGGTYRTIGSSFEFGGLNDLSGRSVKDTLMKEYITYFGISSTAPLLANFVASKVKVIRDEIITFNDNSAGQITSWSWSFPGGVPATSTSQNPQVSYPAIGTYDVTLTVTGNGGTSTATKIGYIKVDNITAVNTLTDLNQVKVYPNPGNGRFTIELPEFEGETSLRVVSMSGSEVYSSITGKSAIKMIQLPESSKGVYILMIDNAKMSKRIKLVVGQ